MQQNTTQDPALRDDSSITTSTATTTTIGASAGPVAGSRSFLPRLSYGDEIALLITFLFAASVVFVTLLLVFKLWQGSALPRHKFGFDFFITRVWDPVFEQFRALPFIYGTVVTTVVSLLIVVPLGIVRLILLALALSSSSLYFGAHSWMIDS